MLPLLCVVAAALATLGSLIVWLWKRAATQAEARRAAQWRAFVSHADGKGGLVSSELPSLVAAPCVAAGLRAAESILAPQPLIRDPVARELCGAHGWAHGQLYARLMAEQEGTGKSLRAAVRARLLDDDLAFALAGFAHSDPDAGEVQVVSLSCGMDTRPWRLRRGAASRGPGSAKLRWFEVDHQAVLETKAKMLADAGLDGTVQSDSGPKPKLTISATAGPKAKRQAPVLAVDELKHVECDLVKGEDLEGPLRRAGFSPSVRTVWVAEGLLSRLPFQRATSLLRDCGNLCPPGSVLLAPVSSAACVKTNAALEIKAKGRCITAAEELMAPGQLDALGWGGAQLSSELAELCRARYKQEAYPAYGRFEALGGLAGLGDVEHVLTATRL